MKEYKILTHRILAQAYRAFILVLTGKKPNSAAISDDISDVFQN